MKKISLTLQNLEKLLNLFSKIAEHLVVTEMFFPENKEEKYLQNFIIFIEMIFFNFIFILSIYFIRLCFFVSHVIIFNHNFFTINCFWCFFTYFFKMNFKNLLSWCRFLGLYLQCCSLCTNFTFIFFIQKRKKSQFCSFKFCFYFNVFF